MRSLTTFVVVAVTFFGASNASVPADSLQGCFKSTTGLSLLSTLSGFNTEGYDEDFNSKGSCGGACRNGTYAAYAMQDKDCFCGQKLPPATTKGDSDECNLICPGYPTEICGGAGYWSVYVTGLTSTIPSNAAAAQSDSPSSTATSSATSSAAASKTTLPNQTIVITASPTATSAATTTSTPTQAAKKSGSSTIGIAVGAVVGIIAVAAIAGGIWFFMRNKKRQELDEEHKRQVAVSQFVNGGKPPGSSGANSYDTRLDPVMAQRRMSDGSIADNQDYSRRILKVTNA